mgnify:CR=1 FL=1
MRVLSYQGVKTQLTQCRRALGGGDVGEGKVPAQQRKPRPPSSSPSSAPPCAHHQDTDPAQYELIKLLLRPPSAPSDPGTHLFVVGDPDQAIYGWRGAEVGEGRLDPGGGGQ